MASKIRIFRSTGATAPSSLEYGELAVTVEQGTSGTSANKAGRLFVGNASGNPVELGGEYTYKLMDHAHGELINSSVAIVDSNGQINGWNVAGILTATRTNITDLVTSNLNITGVATFAQDLNLNGDVTIGDSHTDTLTVESRAGFNTDVTLNKKLLVSGISTFSQSIDVNGGADISGGVGLVVSGNGLNVTGVSTFNNLTTFTGQIDGNGGADISGGETTLSSATVSDLTENRIVVVGSSGALEDDASLTYDGADLSVNSIIVTDLSPDRVLLGGTGGAVQDNANLKYSNDLGLVVNSSGINVTGVSSFIQDVDFAGIVDSATALRSPVGVITALTSTDFVGAAGTFTTAFTLGSGGTKYTLPVVDGSANQVLTTNGAGVVSFQESSSTLVISAGTGSTDGVSLLSDTFTIAATNNETKTTLTDNTITVGLATDIIVGGGVTISNDLLVLGNLTVEGTETIINVERLDVQDKTIGVASTSTASNTTANGGGFFVHAGSDGDKTIFWNLTQNGFEVNQDWLPTADGSLDLGNSGREWQNLFVDGLAELDDVNVSAAATINTLNVTGTGTIATADINGGNIDGTTIGAASSAAGTFLALNALSITTGGPLNAEETTLADLIVSGVTTTTGLLDVNGGANVSGGAGLVVSANGLNVTGVSTFNNNVDFSGTIDVDGQAIFDDVTVSAAATITTVDINGGAIDGTVIGAASSAAATLTTVNYTSLTGGAISAVGSRIDAGDVTFTNLRVTGVSTVASLFLSAGTNTNGVAFFNSSGQVTSTATPSAGIQTSNFILTTNASGVPSWTDTIDCGQF